MLAQTIEHWISWIKVMKHFNYKIHSHKIMWLVYISWIEFSMRDVTNYNWCEYINDCVDNESAHRILEIQLPNVLTSIISAFKKFKWIHIPICIRLKKEKKKVQFEQMANERAIEPYGPMAQWHSGTDKWPGTLKLSANQFESHMCHKFPSN